MRVVDSDYKLRQNIRIAMLYLEDDDAVNAELYIKKASSLVAGNKVVAVLMLYWRDAANAVIEHPILVAS